MLTCENECGTSCDHFRADWRNSVRSGQSGAAAVRATVDELDLGRDSKEDREHFLLVLEVCKRGLLYVLALFVVIAAGCLSGLPSAVNCFALEDAYTTALSFIGGSVGVITIFGYLFLSYAEQAIKRGKIISSKLSKFGFACVLVLLVVLNILAISFLTGRGVQNVGTAIEHCRSVEEAAARQDKIPLHRTFFGGPSL